MIVIRQPHTGVSVRLMDPVHAGKKKLGDSKVMRILSRNGNHKDPGKAEWSEYETKNHR
jgi:hypothetical protein